MNLFAESTEPNGWVESSPLIAFVIYIFLVLLLAFWAGKVRTKKSFLSEYFLGSRSLGVWAFALTFAATSASGGSFIGFPSLVYTHGWSLALWIGSYMLVPLVAMGLISKRINQFARKTDAITVPDILRDRFESPAFGLISTLLIVFFMTFNLIAQFKGGSVILQSLLTDVPAFQSLQTLFDNELITNWGIDPGYFVCLLIFGVAVIVYTTYGGFRAVVWTDVMQGFVMVGGVVVLLPLAIIAAGGMANGTADLQKQTPPKKVVLAISLVGVPERTELPRNTWIQSGEGDKIRIFRTAEKVELDLETRMPVQRDESGADRLVFVIANELTFKPSEPIRFEYDTKSLRCEPLTVRTAKVSNKELNRFKLHSNWELSRSIDATAIRTFFDVQSVDETDDWNSKLTMAEINEEQLKRLGFETSNLPFQYTTLDAQDEFELLTTETDRSSYAAGGEKEGTYTSLPGPSPSDPIGFLPVTVAISFFFFWTFASASQPSNMVRMMAFKDSKTLRSSIFTVSVYFSLIYFPIVIIFCCARTFLPGWETQSDRVMPETAKFLTAMINMPWLFGILIAAPFAAVMSTMDSFLLMISSSMVRDVYQRWINPTANEKKIKRITYLSTIVVGVAAALAALNPPQFLQDIIVFTGAGLATSFLAPVLFALYWPRFNKQAAIASMLAGFGTHILLYIVGTIIAGKMSDYKLFGFHPFLVGVTVSLIVAIFVCLLTTPPPRHLVLRFFYRKKLSDNPKN